MSQREMPRAEGMGWRVGATIITFFGSMIAAHLAVLLLRRFQHLPEPGITLCHRSGLHRGNGRNMGSLGNEARGLRSKALNCECRSVGVDCDGELFGMRF